MPPRDIIAAAALGAIVLVLPYDGDGAALARNHLGTPGRTGPAADNAASPAAAGKPSPGVGNPTTAPTSTNNPGRTGGAPPPGGAPR